MLPLHSEKMRNKNREISATLTLVAAWAGVTADCVLRLSVVAYPHTCFVLCFTLLDEIK